MYAVGDRVDVVAGKHEARNLAVLFGNSVHIMAQVERQKSQVQEIAAAKDILHLFDFMSAENLIHQRDRELIVTGGHRRVRRKHAFFSDRLDIIAVRRRPSGALSLFIQQLERKQARVAFVHVVAGDVAMSQCAQHAHAADTEDDFLAEPVV